MTIHPSQKAVLFNTLINQYGASYFRNAFACYVVGVNHPHFSVQEVETCFFFNLAMAFRSVPVYHKMKLVTASQPDVIVDSVHIKPASRGWEVPGRFDTVLANDSDGKDTGVDG
ncbi:hypothetical protein C8J57DRAFT_978178, partial [Mycena rebaudengoi]